MNRILPIAVWLGTGLVWGTTWGIIRIGLRDLPPFAFAAIRTVVAAAVLLVLAAAWHPRRRPTGADLGFWLWIGLAQIGVPYALIFWAEQHISSALTAILFATFPAFTAVAAHFLLPHERLSGYKAAGALLAVGAVALLVTPGGQALHLGGAGAILLASAAAAAGTVMVRRHGRRTSTLWLTAAQIAGAAIFLSVLAVVLEHDAPMRFTTTAVASVLYLALAVTVGCYLGLFWLLKRIDATLVSMGVVLETGVGVVFGTVGLDERVTWRMGAGFLLVAISVALVTKAARR